MLVRSFQHSTPMTSIFAIHFDCREGDQSRIRKILWYMHGALGHPKPPTSG
jgi:hypothetical protein